ncbi:uncharacterized protein KRP23_12644 [Phytophthora ramorum]|uniref:uncharacterized protein n=1 Tax=Phytophthora ramorum TaxID=164328 RepID=UPI00309F47B1|nr:hypothetical protein KRP23_12644 [Phytophthora ramorum]
MPLLGPLSSKEPLSRVLRLQDSERSDHFGSLHQSSQRLWRLQQVSQTETSTCKLVTRESTSVRELASLRDNDDREELVGGSRATLPDVVVAMECDDEQEPTVPPSSLLDAVMVMDSDDEELPDEQDSARRRSRLVVSGAMDLCPIGDLAPLSNTDSSSGSEEELDSDEEDCEKDESGEELDDERVGKRRLWSWECDYLPLDAVDNMIRSNMAEIEAKKPWRFVFRCLAVPFRFKREEDPFDVFFMRWDDFWRLHGRAVWERAFWQPLLPGSTEYQRRKGRQYRALCAFRELATDLVERIGDRYRRWLGKALHEGWWYRVEPFGLRRLFLRDRRLYEEYLVRRVKDRWPRGRKFLLERGLKPMWCLPESS